MDSKDGESVVAEARKEANLNPPHLESPQMDQLRRAAFRACFALELARRDGLPLPSVRLFPDGSGEFIFPGKLALALRGNADDLTAHIGSNRLSVASTVAEDADAVSIRVSGEVLGREKD